MEIGSIDKKRTTKKKSNNEITLYDGSTSIIELLLFVVGYKCRLLHPSIQRARPPQAQATDVRSGVNWGTDRNAPSDDPMALAVARSV